MDQRQSAYAAARHLRIGGNDRDPVASCGERDKCVRRTAFQQHALMHMRNAAGGIEPIARCKAAVQHKQRLIGQVSDLQRGTACKPILWRQSRYGVHRIERSAGKWSAGGPQHQVYITALETVIEPYTTFFHEVDFHARMRAAVFCQEVREEIFDHVRCSSHTEYPGFSGLEGACAFDQRLAVGQQAPAAP